MWRCDSCGYVQDFDPNDEAAMELHFRGVPKGLCPACARGQNKERKIEAVEMKPEA